ncbi:GntR family transcriptional regulator [Bacillus sp. FJAT-45350]|uniref:GntR family transcriptional regulator n=1 Tax=Bacillus sp. FJAT-45350 TaxID=2011014 RepID=UPI000BB96F57|nr:GntR family transcriptional regulator [Bacillus sp. FJAT-45350]
MDNFIKSEPLHLQAYTIIKSSILNGEFPNGERVVESKLATKFGVSRGPIREAIRMLIQDGLLIQNDGSIQVFQPTTQDIVDILQCRKGLEAIGVRLATKKFSANELKKLSKCIEKTNQAYKRNDFKELGLLDQQFHELIIQGSRNKQLIQLMEVIKSKVIYIRNTIVPNEYIQSIADEHERIYQAILEGDEEKAEREMNYHIRKGTENMVKVLLANKSG